MPDNITVAFVQQYSSNVELLLQQTDSRLAGAVETGSYVGKAASVVEQFGSAAAVLKTGRHEDTPLLDISQDKRWVFPKDYVWASLIDNVDKLRMIIDPTNPYAMAAAAAMNRAKDDVILTAMFATNYVGENGTTTDDISTTYDIGVNTGGTASGMNVAKLQLAIRELMRYNKGELMEPVFTAISSYEHDLLLKEVQVANRDYNGGASVVADGKIQRFAGHNFILTERLSIASGNRQCPTWVKSGMHLGVWNGVTARISERADKNYSTQVFTEMTLGATRTQAGKLFRILCDDQI